MFRTGTYDRISILAPSRERRFRAGRRIKQVRFQSSLPHGSDSYAGTALAVWLYFNPRSLTGATQIIGKNWIRYVISILAPSRERLAAGTVRQNGLLHFNPRSLTGATVWSRLLVNHNLISILAPSRERLALNITSFKLVIISILAPSRERP